MVKWSCPPLWRLTCWLIGIGWFGSFLFGAISPGEAALRPETWPPAVAPPNPLEELPLSHGTPVRIFHTPSATKLCITVINFGPGQTSVRFFHAQDLVGSFRVSAPRLSAICTTASLVELACLDDPCHVAWRVSENP
ncbi:MAG: hypothetical protein D6704_07755 [Nitrospirae bacterium]|nr:MAG: hypothetical protein D6704_07755 [Nitrospirota bacterium]